jgi:hypothetical protein
MSSERDVTRVVESWLEEGPALLPDPILDAVVDQLPATHQRRAGWLARRSPIMNSNIARLGLAAAAVVAAAVLGFSLLRGASNVGGPGATATPSPRATALTSPTPESSQIGWLSGDVAPGRYDVEVNGIAFSFAVAESGWGIDPNYGMLERGPHPPSDPAYRWIAFFNDFDQVATDPCNGLAETVGPTVDDFATALTTIPGTDAEGPTDVTVGGLPAKLVVLTIHDDITCPVNTFYLYGQDSAYPNSLASVIREWVLEVNGKRYQIHADQAAPDDAITAEIERIIGSILFE